MKSFILLEHAAFYANHGVLPQERLVGNEFVVDLKLTLDLQKASLSDALSDTVSYADIYDVIGQEIAVPSNLLEHVAGRIIRRLQQDFKQIEGIELKLSKRNPPMGGQVDSASVVFIV